MPIGLVYARESFRKDDVPIERQVDTGRQDVQAHGLTPEIHVEPKGHRSGRSDKKRPEWRIVKKRLQDADVKMLWVADISRATRSKSEFFRLIEELRQRKVQLVSHRESFDTTTAAGRAMMGMIAVMNEWFAEDIAERRKIQAQYLREKGVPLGPPPQGLKYEGRGAERHYIPDEDACYTVEGHERTALDTVQAWLELLAGTPPIGAVRGAVLLNAQGYRYLSHQKTPGLIDSTHLIKLNRHIYDPQQPDRPSAYTGILDRQLIVRARERLSARSHFAHNGHGQVHPPLLLKGLIRCTACEGRYYTQYNSKRGRFYPQYRHGRGECATVIVRPAFIEDHILEELRCVAALPDATLRRYAAHIPTVPDPHAERRNFLKAKLLRLEKYLVDGSISEETYKKERPTAEAELANVPPPPLAPSKSPEEYLKLLRDLPQLLRDLKTLDAYVANEIVGYYIQTIWMTGREIKKIDWQPWLTRLVDESDHGVVD